MSKPGQAAVWKRMWAEDPEGAREEMLAQRAKAAARSLEEARAHRDEVAARRCEKCGEPTNSGVRKRCVLCAFGRPKAAAVPDKAPVPFMDCRCHKSRRAVRALRSALRVVTERLDALEQMLDALPPEANGEKCACGRPVPPGREKHCSVTCKNRAADRLRKARERGRA